MHGSGGGLDFAEDLAEASGAIKELWGCTKLNLGSFGDTNPHLHFHIVPKYEGGFEFGGAFAITNPEPVYLTDGEYQEMISALKAKLGI
ncbi:MAG: HIT family protein [Dysosmobacter sp.]